ncbi:hypothetical protein LDVICp221 [lymphocystis disease virus-China]|uniref:Uncharacterized protein n=1 Tax=lymphocystis disease virus-China TaxID=256729 RepID=Q677P3_9VIRU|nr:hypothetical protein LDVICp221 [lymphocystis disease virus-China]AAU11064.1 hypothetical protein [lymphocystis disease virus-China]
MLKGIYLLTRVIDAVLSVKKVNSECVVGDAFRIKGLTPELYMQLFIYSLGVKELNPKAYISERSKQV